MIRPLRHFARRLTQWWARRALRAMPYTEFTFAALGRIAKASDTVRPMHIDEARRLMQDLGLSARDRQRAVGWFNAGKSPDFDFAPKARACRAITEDRAVLNALAIESMCSMASADGPPTTTRRGELHRLATLLGVSIDELAAAEARVAEHRWRNLPAELRRAYTLLDVDHRAGDAELKLAYRRHMSRHHPDKLGAATDSALVQRARENSVAIRAAYDLIRANRSGASTTR
jgi:DnaJ like chaperone protein